MSVNIEFTDDDFVHVWENLPTIPVGSVRYTWPSHTYEHAVTQIYIWRSYIQQKVGTSDMVLSVKGACYESLKIQVQSRNPSEDKRGNCPGQPGLHMRPCIWTTRIYIKSQHRGW